MAAEKCPVVQINLNYLDKIGRREITVITDKKTIIADLTGQKNTNKQKSNKIQHYQGLHLLHAAQGGFKRGNPLLVYT